MQLSRHFQCCPKTNWTFKWRTSRAPRTSAVQHFISEVMSKLDNVENICGQAGKGGGNPDNALQGQGQCPRGTMFKLKISVGREAGGGVSTWTICLGPDREHRYRGKPTSARLIIIPLHGSRPSQNVIELPHSGRKEAAFPV